MNFQQCNFPQLPPTIKACVQLLGEVQWCDHWPGLRVPSTSIFTRKDFGVARCERGDRNQKASNDDSS
jgi:hypothetical protein